MAKYLVEMYVPVEVEINDWENVVDRPVRNEDGWYNEGLTAEDVIKALAYNCVVNGVNDPSSLDGWADLPSDSSRMDVVYSETYADRVVKLS